MGKNKLRKFSEMEHMPGVLQFPFGALQAEGFPHRGHWHGQVFDTANPIVLELGCGKGEYTVGMAANNADKNYVGIDIKGARMYTGAKQAQEAQMTNAKFLRTNIELLPLFFAPGEVAEIWITFPDPHMKKARKRLTGALFLEKYRQVMGADGGLVHLKTDSPFLYQYTRELAQANGIPVLADTADLYADASAALPPSLRQIRTYYEQQWLSRGKAIKYLCLQLPPAGAPPIVDIDDSHIERDDYRAYPRHSVIQPD